MVRAWSWRPAVTGVFWRLAAVWVLASGVAAAQVAPPTEVVVISPDPAAPLSIRVAAELRQLGLRVIFVRQPDTEAMGPTSLEATAQGVGAFAAVRVVRAGPAVEVWIADRTTGKTVIREVVDAEQAGTDADVALGAVELLRASLLELQVPERPRQAEVEPAPEVLQVIPAPPSPPTPEADGGGPGETAAALGVAVDPGLGGFRPGLGAQVLVSRRFGEWFGVEAMGDVLFASIDDSPRATAATTTSWVGAAAMVAPTVGRLQPRLGAGAGAAHLQLQGSGEAAGYLGRQIEKWLAVVHVRSGLAVRLHPTLRWRIDATLLASLSEVVVAFDENRVATWGRPTLVGATSLELVVR